MSEQSILLHLLYYMNYLNLKLPIFCHYSINVSIWSKSTLTIQNVYSFKRSFFDYRGLRNLHATKHSSPDSSPVDILKKHQNET